MRILPGAWLNEFVPPDRERRIEDWAESLPCIVEVWAFSSPDSEGVGFDTKIDLGVRLDEVLSEEWASDRLRVWSLLLSAALGGPAGANGGSDGSPLLRNTTVPQGGAGIRLHKTLTLGEKMQLLGTKRVGECVDGSVTEGGGQVGWLRERRNREWGGRETGCRNAQFITFAAHDTHTPHVTLTQLMLPVGAVRTGW